MSYDERCHDLATYFLPSELETSDLVAKLAQTIQTAIEDWLEDLPADHKDKT